MGDNYLGLYDSIEEAILERKGHSLSVLRDEERDKDKNKDLWRRGRLTEGKISRKTKTWLS